MKKRLIIILIIGLGIIVAGGILCYNAYKRFDTGRGNIPANAVVVIKPYRYASTWVFDDISAGVVREPFISGAPEIIDELVKDIPDADTGFRMLFSANPFPEYDIQLVWDGEAEGGNYYYCKQYDIRAWLCPALYKYYHEAPKQIFVKAEALNK